MTLVSFRRLYTVAAYLWNVVSALYFRLSSLRWLWVYDVFLLCCKWLSSDGFVCVCWHEHWDSAREKSYIFCVLLLLFNGENMSTCYFQVLVSCGHMLNSGCSADATVCFWCLHLCFTSRWIILYDIMALWSYSMCFAGCFHHPVSDLRRWQVWAGCCVYVCVCMCVCIPEALTGWYAPHPLAQAVLVLHYTFSSFVWCFPVL